ncbi:MAG: hypothetical protein ACRD0A_08795 [Acidimicrobiales bacterium]
MDTEHTRATPPVVCDMTDAPDTPAERLDEYRRLFAHALIGRERTERGIRFRFRSDEVLEEWIRDLAARERACCAFFTFDVTVHGAELWWDARVIDDDAARAVLDGFYGLPDLLIASPTTPTHNRSRHPPPTPDSHLSVSICIRGTTAGRPHLGYAPE